MIFGNNKNPPQQPQDNSEMYNQQEVPMGYTSEASVSNVLDQIDPQSIIDNFNHALKGEYFNKEKGVWEFAGDGTPLVNDSCRSWIISYLTAIMNKSSTLGTIDKLQFSSLMDGIIRNVTREFVSNLEKFGFVPKGPDYLNSNYYNRGIPDSSRMDTVAEAIYQRAFMIYSRSVNGMDSRKIFGSLSMHDPMMFGGSQQGGGGWASGLFKR